MSEDQVLDAASRHAQLLQQSEVGLLEVAYQWAVLHTVDRLDPHQTRLPGREQGRRYGGTGVSEVSEFAAAELGARCSGPASKPARSAPPTPATS